jgi:hypothetical protein
MNDHADLELIAAFREGLLDSGPSERVAGHLAVCPACAARGRAVAQVTARLAGAAAPPMPPDLVRRLDAVLAAEIAAADAAAGTAAAEGNGQPVTGVVRTLPVTRAARPRRRLAAVLRPLAAAAAVCLLAGGGYLLLHSIGSAPASHSAAQQPRSSAALPAGGATGGRQLQSGANAAEAAAAVVVHSNTDYQAGQLQTQADAALRRYASSMSPRVKTGSIPLNPVPTSAVSGCLQGITTVGGQRLLVDEATYQGQRAVVIISPASSGRPGHVWVVSGACTTSAGHLIAQSQLP